MVAQAQHEVAVHALMVNGFLTIGYRIDLIHRMKFLQHIEALQFDFHRTVLQE